MVEGGWKITAAAMFPQGTSGIFSLDGSAAFDTLTLAVLLAVVSLFIYEFYKSISKKNLIKLNLYKYNTSDHPLTSKFVAIVLYLVEYIVIIPFLIILWFSGLAVVLFLIAKEMPAIQILMVSAAIVGAIRILAYFKVEISKELAKLFPFITLSVFILSPGEFNYNYKSIFEKLIGLPEHLGSVFSYILIILFIEIILRALFTVYEFWRSEEVASEEETTKRKS